MKLVLLTFAGACSAWATSNNVKAQAFLSDTGAHAISDTPPVPDVALPTMTRKLTHINGADCKQNPYVVLVC